jgi:FkbM family methyltransferase
MYTDLSSLAAQAACDSGVGSPWLNGSKPVLLYGSGSFGRDVMEALKAEGVSVAGFIDGKIEAPTVRHGLTTYPLHHEATEKFAGDKHPVLLTVFNPAANWVEIVKDIRHCGFSTVITPMEIYDWLEHRLGSRYWMAPGKFYRDNWQKFLDAQNLWHDDASREIYAQILWFRYGRRLEAHPVIQADHQYAPTDLPRWSEPLRLVDGGACQGEAIRTLKQSGYHFEQIYAFEPDLSNFEKLSSYLKRDFRETHTTLFPCGLWSRTEKLSFAGGLGAASAVSGSGDEKITVLRLDEVLGQQPLSLVKLDVEGAEMQAMEGMRSIIEKYRPGLAICVYHQPGDIVNIPMTIKSWNIGYKLYLRAHCWNTFDSVAYALPIERLTA